MGNIFDSPYSPEFEERYEEASKLVTDGMDFAFKIENMDSEKHIEAFIICAKHLHMTRKQFESSGLWAVLPIANIAIGLMMLFPGEERKILERIKEEEITEIAKYLVEKRRNTGSPKDETEILSNIPSKYLMSEGSGQPTGQVNVERLNKLINDLKDFGEKAKNRGF